MKKLAILGLGHIGSYVYDTLSEDSSFDVVGYDKTLGHDLSDELLLHSIIRNVDGVLASTPFYLNTKIANICAQHDVDYFDLTESVDVTNHIKMLCNSGAVTKSRFVTQCGLAPGMVSIIANKMASKFDVVDTIEIRVGALPQSSNNMLQYYRTWNTEGLINEYINPCPALVNGVRVDLDPVADIESVSFDGVTLEAANTSGGIGSLVDSYANVARNVNYKTLRYPGHWNAIKLLQQLGLQQNFDTYVRLFNENIPVTKQDIIYILINVVGSIDNVRSVYTYKQRIDSNDSHNTAIQISTAGGVMAVLDSWANGGMDSMASGWVKQEQLDYDSVWNSKYSWCYR